MRLAQRLLLGAVLIVSVLMGLALILSDQRLSDRLERLTAAQLGREARLIAQEWRPAANADALADSAGVALGHRVTLVDAGGHVLGDSEFDGPALSALQNHASRPEITAALRDGLGMSKRTSPSEGDVELYVAVPAGAGRVARVSIGTSELQEIVSGARRDVFISGLIALLVAIAMAAVFSRQITEPVKELRDVTTAIAAGDLSRRPSLSAPGELGDLAVAVHRMTEQLTQLESMRRDFVANVSHELKTPLTAIRGFAETLIGELTHASQHAHFAETIRANAERMQRLVDDLLDLSRIESGGWVPTPTIVNLATPATEIADAYRRTAAQRGTTIAVDIAPDAQKVRVDPTALRQTLSNLVENAVRHTTAGTVTIFARSEKDHLVIGVHDTGFGIPAEHLSRIFERFYRVDPARSRAAGGTGLGLAIVKHLVEAHGGHVAAASGVDEGTTISLYFPRTGL
ncbi:MAG TPA: ATP-binding protein [Gemmatimonadaceae bacterium]|nr:ATP-binding protein [Gemmatimonadaceae bacterium]